MVFIFVNVQLSIKVVYYIMTFSLLNCENTKKEIEKEYASCQR